MRKALAEKILVLGIDGMDPRLTRRYVDEGRMPNTKKLIDKGAARADLTMLGECRLSRRLCGRPWLQALIPLRTALPASGGSPRRI